MLNRQFHSVFSNDNGNDISEMDGFEYPQINNLTINVKAFENKTV